MDEDCFPDANDRREDDTAVRRRDDLRFVAVGTVLITIAAIVLVGVAGGAVAAADGGDTDDAVVATIDEGDIDERTGCADGICGERVEDPAGDHHSAVVWIDPVPDEDLSATGVLVEDDVVVTAAHVVSDSLEQEPFPADDITIAPARDGTEKPYGTVGVEEVHFDDGWDHSPSGVEAGAIDFALLRLAEPIGEETGTMAYAPTPEVADDADAIGEVTLAGYPDVDRFDGGGYTEYTVWSDTGMVELVESDAERPFLQAPPVGDGDGLESTAGHSGGPIFTDVGGEPTVVGILQGPVVDEEGFHIAETEAAAITADRVETVRSFSEAGAPPSVDVEVTDAPDTVSPEATEVVIEVTASLDELVGTTAEIDLAVDGDVVDATTIDLEGGGERSFTRSLSIEPTAGETLEIAVQSESDEAVHSVEVTEDSDPASVDGDADTGDDDPDAETGADDGDSQVPGFGLGASLLGLLGASYVLRRRRLHETTG